LCVCVFCVVVVVVGEWVSVFCNFCRFAFIEHG
jgi:hypothetical protein